MGSNSEADVTAQIEGLLQWKADTDQELQQVKALLDEVAKVCSELDNDDTVYGWFKKCGEALGNEYVEMSNAFTEAVNIAGEVVKDIGKGIAGIGEFISNWAKKHHL